MSSLSSSQEGDSRTPGHGGSAPVEVAAAFSRRLSVEHGMTHLYSSSSLHTIPEQPDTPSPSTIALPSQPPQPSPSSPVSTAASASARPAPLRARDGGAPASAVPPSRGSANTPAAAPRAEKPSSSPTAFHGGSTRHRTFCEPPVCVSQTTSAQAWVRVHVGGTVFTTTLATLCADPESMLCAMCAPLAAAPSPSVPPPTTTASITVHVDPTALTSPVFAMDDDSGAAEMCRRKDCATATASTARTASSTRAPTSLTAAATRASVAGGGESMSPHADVTFPGGSCDVLPLDVDDHNSLLLDLDPEYFAPVLNFLRHGTLLIPPSCNPRGVLAVATYLNVRGVVAMLTPRPRVMPQYLFSWGSGTHGELGTQRLADSDAPTPFRMTPFGVRVVQVALGANYSIVLSDRGEVYSVGNADWGQLGLGNPRLLETNPANRAKVQLIPRRIPLFEQQPALSIAAGYAFAMAITEGHHVYFWGNNNHAQGGLGAAYLDAQFKKMDSPCLVKTLEGKQIVQVGCGSFFGLARSADGELYSWGLVECTGLGTLEEVRHRFVGTDVVGLALSNEGRHVVHTPQRVRFPVNDAGSTTTRLTHMHAGQWHSGAINDRGELFTWGVGYQGRLGHGDKEPAYTPRQVRGALAGHWVVDVACGSFHTVALTNRGAVFCWGDNASGQCGLHTPSAAGGAVSSPTTAQPSMSSVSGTTPEAVTSPCRVVGLEFVAGGVARGVSCGRQHTTIIMDGPQPGCWEACCRLDHRGRPRGQHRQVFVIGERLRMLDVLSGGRGRGGCGGVQGSGGGRSSSGGHAHHDGLGLGATTVDGRRLSRSAAAASLTGRYGTGSEGSPLHLSRAAATAALHRRYTMDAHGSPDLDDDEDMDAMPAAAFESPINQQFQRVPGLETLDVHRVVSGLHHTFVCAEAVRLFTRPRTVHRSRRRPLHDRGTVTRFVSLHGGGGGGAMRGGAVLESSGTTSDNWAPSDAMEDDDEEDDDYVY